CLDAFAEHQHALGRRYFRSIAWPSWRGVGVASGTAAGPSARVGLAELSPSEGLRILEQVLAAEGPARLLPVPPAPASPPGPIRVAPAPVAVGPLPEPDRAAPAVAGVAVGAAASAGPSWLAEIFAEALGVPAARLDPTAEFGDLGIESVLLAEL